MRYGMNMLLWTSHVTQAHWGHIEYLAELGYDTVEIPVFQNTDPDAYAALGRRLDALGLRRTATVALAADQNIVSDDPAVRRAGQQALERSVACAAALGASILAGPLHSALGVFSGRGPTPVELEWSARALRRAADCARPGGVHLAIEFLNRFECYLSNDTASAVRLCEMVGPDVGVLYDSFHAHIEEKDPGAAIRAHGARISHVHISENDRSTPGRGQVRWRETFDALEDVGYDGILMVEAFGLALPELSAATRIWRRMFDDERTLAREALHFMRAQVRD